MSTRLVGATIWNAAKAIANTLLTDMNAVIITSTTGSIAPAITLEAAVGLITRTITVGDLVKDDEYMDADGIVTKYNLLRKYESCRRYTSGAVWQYGKTVVSADVIGHRTAAFPAGTPDYITPPAAGDLIRNFALTNDILEIVTAGCAIHRGGILGLAPGTEYVVINECHSNCHSSCHGDCRRGKR